MCDEGITNTTLPRSPLLWRGPTHLISDKEVVHVIGIQPQRAHVCRATTIQSRKARSLKSFPNASRSFLLGLCPLLQPKLLGLQAHLHTFTGHGHDDVLRHLATVVFDVIAYSPAIVAAEIQPLSQRFLFSGLAECLKLLLIGPSILVIGSLHIVLSLVPQAQIPYAASLFIFVVTQSHYCILIPFGTYKKCIDSMRCGLVESPSSSLNRKYRLLPVSLKRA